MKKIKLYNGYEIPAIGYGTYALKSNLENVMPVLIAQEDILIDSSDNYGNEELIGQYFKNSVLKKEYNNNVIIMTKFSNPRRTIKLNNYFVKSKKNLDHRINIYLLHWPYPFLWKMQWRKLEKLYNDGEVDAIGVCNFDKKNLIKLMKFCKVKPMINQYECHPMFVQYDLAEYCKQNNIQIISYSPFARCDKRLFENKDILKLSQKYGKTVGQVILRWNYQHEYIPIPATSNVEHIKSNYDIFDFKLTQDEMITLDSLDCGMRVRMDLRDRFSPLKKIEYLVFRIMAFFKICI